MPKASWTNGGCLPSLLSTKLISVCRGKSIFKRAATPFTDSDDWFAKANTHIHRLSKAVVPIGYVKGGRFEPDPALPQPFVPALAEIAELAQAEPGSDPFYRFRTLLIRRVNRLADELKQAIAVTRQAALELEVWQTIF